MHSVELPELLLELVLMGKSFIIILYLAVVCVRVCVRVRVRVRVFTHSI